MKTLLLLALVYSVNLYAQPQLSSALETQPHALTVFSSEVPEPKTQSHFESLFDWFKEGRELSFEEIDGFYSGRCFHRKSKSTPTNSAIGFGVLKGNKSGPAFPASRLYFGVDNPSKPADHFDNFDLSELKTTFDRLAASESEHISNPILNQANWDLDWEANGNIDERHELVAYNEFIIEKWTAQFPQKYRGEFLEPGEILQMCYYFKELEE